MRRTSVTSASTQPTRGPAGRAPAGGAFRRQSLHLCKRGSHMREASLDEPPERSSKRSSSYTDLVGQLGQLAASGQGSDSVAVSPYPPAPGPPPASRGSPPGRSPGGCSPSSSCGEESSGPPVPAGPPGPGPGAAGSTAVEGMLLRLDHMRDRRNYVRQVGEWCLQLGLWGRVVFHGKRIMIALQGTRRGLRQYVQLHRSASIDVDSKGRRCRERMMTVLYEGAPQGEALPSGFEVLDAEAVQEVRDVLSPLGLERFAAHGLAHVE